MVFPDLSFYKKEHDVEGGDIRLGSLTQRAEIWSPHPLSSAFCTNLCCSDYSHCCYYY